MGGLTGNTGARAVLGQRNDFLGENPVVVRTPIARPTPLAFRWG